MAPSSSTPRSIAGLENEKAKFRYSAFDAGRLLWRRRRLCTRPNPGLAAGEPSGDQRAIPRGLLRRNLMKPVFSLMVCQGVARRRSGNPLWTIPLASLHITRERPLFSASRRPPAPIVAETPKVSNPIPPQPPTEPEKPQVTLVGIVQGPSVEMGVFVDETDKSLVRLRVGQSVRGWTVDGVDERAATLEKAEHQVKLELPARNTETAAATSPDTEETASVARGPSAPIHGTPVGRIKPFATAERYK